VLTRRESEVLVFPGRGLSNKEIGCELRLSVATVKHHVHHILEKLKLERRAQAMRRVRDAPWLARTALQMGKK
jgi:two-component system, NarL family, nitrate/nitrite response regulator NarL